MNDEACAIRLQAQMAQDRIVAAKHKEGLGSDEDDDLIETDCSC